jgi:hypothetical protein
MPKELFQVQPPAPDAVGVPACQPQGFPIRPFGRSAIFGYEKDDGFQDGSGSSCPGGKVRKGWEKPTSQLHTRIKGEVIKEISNYLDERLVGCDVFEVLSPAFGSVDLLLGTIC